MADYILPIISIILTILTIVITNSIYLKKAGRQEGMNEGTITMSIQNMQKSLENITDELKKINIEHILYRLDQNDRELENIEIEIKDYKNSIRRIHDRIDSVINNN